MSGHSHAKKIKHDKELSDKKRGQMFSKLARAITIAVKEGGPNPEANNKLKAATEQARKFNLPKENIERAIRQATGTGEEANLEEVIFEAYGPGGVAIIIEGITDNKNRAFNEVRQALNQHGGKLVGEGGVKWMFEKKIKEPGSLEWVPKQEIETDEKTKDACQKLFEALDELDSVQEIYSNIKYV